MQAFYERYYSYALSICSAYAPNREDARELLNDGFLKVFQRINDLRDEAALLPWLRRIMVNTAIDCYRKNQKRTADLSTDLMTQEIQEPYLNDDAVFAQFAAEHILTLLHQLPDAFRMVFSLYVLDGYTHREIATKLGITDSTSRAYLTEANRLLRQALTTQLPENHERTKQ